MSRERSAEIRDEGSLHAYYAAIPNTVVRGMKSRGLSVHAKWLYVYLKSVAGDDRECFQGTRMLAQGSGLSLGTITTAKRELQDAKLITIIAGKHGAHSTDRIRIKDIWTSNMQEFSRSVQQVNDDYHERSTGERSVQQVNAILRRSHEEDPMKKEDSPLPPQSASIAPPSKYKHKALSTDYSPGFMQWWEVYPHDRRVGKLKCFEVWVAERLEPRADELCNKITRLAMTTWYGKERKFIPHASTWLNGGRYEDELIPLDTPGAQTATDLRVSAKGQYNLATTDQFLQETGYYDHAGSQGLQSLPGPTGGGL